MPLTQQNNAPDSLLQPQSITMTTITVYKITDALASWVTDSVCVIKSDKLCVNRMLVKVHIVSLSLQLCGENSAEHDGEENESGCRLPGSVRFYISHTTHTVHSQQKLQYWHYQLPTETVSDNHLGSCFSLLSGDSSYTGALNEMDTYVSPVQFLSSMGTHEMSPRVVTGIHQNSVHCLPSLSQMIQKPLVHFGPYSLNTWHAGDCVSIHTVPSASAPHMSAVLDPSVFACTHCLFQHHGESTSTACNELHIHAQMMLNWGNTERAFYAQRAYIVGRPHELLHQFGAGLFGCDIFPGWQTCKETGHSVYFLTGLLMAVNCLVHTMLVLCLLSLLPKNRRGKQKDVTGVHHHVLRKSLAFELNCSQNQILSNESCKLGGMRLKMGAIFEKRQLESVLNEHALPWRMKTKLSMQECDIEHSCCACGTACCCTYRGYMQIVFPRVSQVWPVTQFLPDATRDPRVDLAFVGYRLATLSALPSSSPVSRVRLAEAGFYSRGHGDEVMCFSCHASYSGWTGADNPMDIHRRLSPQCPHILNRQQESAALFAAASVTGSRYDATALPSQPTQMTASISEHMEDGQNSGLSREQHVLSTQASAMSVDSQHGGAAMAGNNTRQRGPSSTVTALPAPRLPATPSNNGNAEVRPLFPQAGLDLGWAVYPFYQDMASRRRSFTRWDDSLAPPLEQILLCGMFYAGYEDCVRCFYCGVGLKRWVVTDDVWMEHVRWRPECGYLRAVKGDSFINNMQRRLERSGRQIQGNSMVIATSRATPAVSASLTSASSVSTSSTMITTHAMLATSASSASASSGSSTSSTVTTIHVPAASTLAAPTSASSMTPTATTTSAGTGSTPSTSVSSSNMARSVQASSGVTSVSGGHGNQPVISSASSVAAEGASAEREEAADGEDVEQMADQEAEDTRYQCRVCRQEMIDTLLLPCGHLVVCQVCAPSQRSCPLCHESVRATVRVHME